MNNETTQALRERLERYGQMMFDAGMDANSDFADRHCDSRTRQADAEALLAEILASQPAGEAAQGVPEGWPGTRDDLMAMMCDATRWRIQEARKKHGAWPGDPSVQDYSSTVATPQPQQDTYVAWLENPHTKDLLASVKENYTRKAPAASGEPVAETDEDRFHCHDCDHRWNAVDDTERPRAECPNCGSSTTNVDGPPAASGARDALLGAAIERAARDLPDGWEVHVCVERGAGWAILYNPNGDVVELEDQDSDNRLVAEVNAAIDAARTTADEKAQAEPDQTKGGGA